MMSPHPLQPEAIRAHTPAQRATAFAMALHPGVKSQDIAFETQLPLKVWQAAARAVGITPKKSHTRSRLASLIKQHNARAAPADRLSLWNPPITL
ncbi:MAG: hypothetical protein ACI8RZ_001462 [Myxococcota bacterium]|jgi:hypothetical protein